MACGNRLPISTPPQRLPVTRFAWSNVHGMAHHTRSQNRRRTQYLCGGLTGLAHRLRCKAMIERTVSLPGLHLRAGGHRAPHESPRLHHRFFQRCTEGQVRRHGRRQRAPGAMQVATRNAWRGKSAPRCIGLDIGTACPVRAGNGQQARIALDKGRSRMCYLKIIAGRANRAAMHRPIR